jgi:4-amino-4-deoxy-L-arabinose transferase-like glycosyltransferase
VTLALLGALYLLPGLVGHDPWKSADVTYFGVILSQLESGQWLIPHLLGQPYLAQGPLFYWLAAPLTKVLGALLPMHDAARLAGGVFGAAYFVLIGAAARAWFGREAVPGAVLLAMGCIGQLIHIHTTEPTIALLAAQAGLLWTLGHLHRGVAWGLASGVALAALGLTGGLAHVVAGMALVLVAASVAGWSVGGRPALAALLVGAVLTALWPIVLQQHNPAAYAQWRELTLDLVSEPARLPARLAGYLTVLPWFAWPALPLALWSLWKHRRQPWRGAARLFLTGFLVFLGAAALTDSPRSVSALPMLPTLVLLAAPGLPLLRRGGANLFDWFGTMTFTVFTIFVWLGWVAMLFGWPARLARNFARQEPGFVLQFQPVAVALAVLLTLCWLWLILTARRAPTRGALIWAGGIAVFWGLLITLWLPWIDYGRSYRQTSESLARAMPAERNCIAELHLSDAQRASFYYFSGIATVPGETAAASECRLLLIHSSSNRETSLGREWTKLWQGGRPGARGERFWLYQRTE